MRIRVTAALFLLLTATSAVADGPWSGTWDTRWRGGGARLTLEQTGSAIEGTYPLYGGRVTGTVEGRRFDGRWIEGARSGGFVFVLASDGNSFMGRYDSGEWWTGARVSGVGASGLTVDQSSPRDTFRTFVVAGNMARRGHLDELGKALEVLEFGEEDKGLLRGQKLDRAKDLFAAVDETTFRIWSLPENADDKAEAAATLKQAGTEVPLPIDFRRGSDGRWRIVMPAAAALAETTRRLLERHGGKPLPPDEHLKLANPRAALETFLEGMSTWDADGGAQAVATLNLAQVPESIRAHEGPLAAEYLKQILDRVSFFLPQEIPDDPTSREPYVLFEHPAGRVVLTPSGEGAAARWLFTADTVRTLRPLYAALENMPVATDLITPARPASSSFFAIRRTIGSLSPALLKPIGSIELWQLLGMIVVAGLGLAVSWFAAPATTRIASRHSLARRPETGTGHTGDFMWPLRLLLTALLWFLGARLLGLSDLVEQVVEGAIVLLVATGAVWMGVLVIDRISRIAMRRAEATVTTLDDMFVTFVSMAAKIALVAAGAVAIADQLGIPYQGIVAGLGIGGLAVAFASRETLSNIFGAGILLADRPFRRGDLIVTADNTEGTVEQVGIRSTRIRTHDDTIVVVPNGKLVDATINNYGARRQRRVRCMLAISYATRPEDLDAFVGALRDLPRSHPGLVAEKTEAGVWQLTESAVEVEFIGYVRAASNIEERHARQAVLLDIVRLAGQLGVTFAGAENPVEELAERLDRGRIGRSARDH